MDARTAGATPALSLLWQASQVIFSTRDRSRLPQVIVQASMNVMAADTATLLLPGVDGTLYVAYAHGLDIATQRSVRITPGEGIAGRVAQTREPLIINGEVSAANQSTPARRSRAKASIVYPVVSGDRLVGVLTFNRMDDARPYTVYDLETACVLAAHVVLALETRRLAQQVGASEKLAAVGELAAGVAHEINTPTQFIGDSAYFLDSAFADLRALLAHYAAWRDRLAAGESIEALAADAAALEEQLEADFLLAEIPKAIRRIADGATRISDIVRAVQDFGRPELQEWQQVDLNQSIRTTLTLARHEYEEVADVRTQLGDLPLVECNAREINHALLSLLINAAHAIADKGLPPPGRGLISICAHADQDAVVISVEDDGVGIALDVQDRIFEPFFTTKAIGRGAGLGLATSHATIVDKHGGSLTFESEVGRGTRFTVRLPIRSRVEHPSADSLGA